MLFSIFNWIKYGDPFYCNRLRVTSDNISLLYFTLVLLQDGIDDITEFHDLKNDGNEIPYNKFVHTFWFQINVWSSWILENSRNGEQVIPLCSEQTASESITWSCRLCKSTTIQCLFQATPSGTEKSIWRREEGFIYNTGLIIKLPVKV